jgi:hypothetical protein
MSSGVSSSMGWYVPRERVGETELHGANVLGVDIVEEGRELGTDTTVEVLDGRVGDDLEGELLGDGSSCKHTSQ